MLLDIIMNFCFAADRSLGKLAKWLRIMGFDTDYESDTSSRFFLEKLEKKRVLLTRTQKIKKMFADHRMVFIVSNDLTEQLKQVINEIGLTIEDIRLFSRCIQCNISIIDIDKDSVFGFVPDYVWETQERFQRCPQCDRIYWSGSHSKRSLQKIGRLFQ